MRVNIIYIYIYIYIYISDNLEICLKQGEAVRTAQYIYIYMNERDETSGNISFVVLIFDYSQLISTLPLILIRRKELFFF